MRLTKGFTLLELVIVMVVIAIVSSIALTAASAFLQDNRLATANNDLIAAISYTRTEAVTRGQHVSICASNDRKTCTNTPWELGWLVFTDEKNAGVVDANETILRSHGEVGIDISVSAGSPYLQFKSAGTVAYACPDCFDATGTSFRELALTAFKNLLPVNNAMASTESMSSDSGSNDASTSGSDTDSMDSADSGQSGASGSEGTSGLSGSSGSSGSGTGSGSSAAKGPNSGQPFVTCFAPPSQAKGGSTNTSSNGNSGSNGGSGSSGSGSSGSRSGSSGSEGSSGADGSDTDSSSDSALNQRQFIDIARDVLAALSPVSSVHAAAPQANCDFGSGSSALPDSTFLICDSTRNGEKGKLISVAKVGRVTRNIAICN